MSETRIKLLFIKPLSHSAGQCGQPHRLSKRLWATASVVQGEGGQAVGGRRFGGRPTAVHARRQARHSPQPVPPASITTTPTTGQARTCAAHNRAEKRPLKRHEFYPTILP